MHDAIHKKNRLVVKVIRDTLNGLLGVKAGCCAWTYSVMSLL